MVEVQPFDVIRARGRNGGEQGGEGDEREEAVDFFHKPAATIARQDDNLRHECKEGKF
jgi:hypothetical protein